MEDHLRTIGLGNKIRGAVSQGGYLIGLAVALGHDDDGDQRKPVICLDSVKKCKAVHDGHHHIQQDHGNVIGVLPQNVEGFLTVSRLQNPIAVGQYPAQNRAVQRIILYNQNLLLHRYNPFSL